MEAPEEAGVGSVIIATNARPPTPLWSPGTCPAPFFGSTFTVLTKDDERSNKMNERPKKRKSSYMRGLEARQAAARQERAGFAGRARRL